MRPRDALRSAARYHLRAFVPTAAGAGLAGVGLWYGLRSGDGTLLSPTAFAAPERAVPALALVAVGLLVVAFGRTAARVATTADLVAAEVESARDDGIDPDDLRETVSLAVQHSVADATDVASDRMVSNVETAVSRALEDATGDSDDVAGRSAEDRPRAGEEDAGDAEDGALADPLAEASRRAGERMESLLDGDDSEFPEATPKTESDGAEILAAADAGESTLPDGVATDDATGDDAEILDAGRRDGGETAVADGDGSDDSDAEMVFGTDLKDAE